MMKKCFACFRAGAGLAFSLFGAVVGAGFMTGAELVRFFPLRAAFAHAAVAAGLFAACFLLLFDAGRKCGGFEGALRCCGRAAPVFRALLHFASFITCAAMLAGLDGAVRTGFGLRYALPVAALCALPAMFFVARRGMRGVAALSAALVPVMAAVFAARAGDIPAGFTPSSPQSAFTSLTGVCLYAAMNCFLAAPLACDAGREGAGRGGCIAAAALIGFCIAAALGAVARAGTAGEEMPFLAAGGGGPAAVACICAVLTTLFSSFYPLARAAEQYSAEKGGKERHKKRKEEHTADAERGTKESRALPVRERAAAVQAGLCAGAFLLSLCGLSGIVRAVYPLIGMAGAAFFLLLAARRLPSLLSSSPAQQQLFRQRHQGVHARGQQAEDGCRRHHQV
ncbi:MAG TPA: hypothetical protein H9851_04410 [Candidatus Borkfalkia faecavium]|uniref:Uncharacterized protein n=1 Tax=Candidatus Borkfalkia faecavium TaxID=2838508 RepID=A0A9D1W0U2_9FIRM|nr:hypothetical protein [Candidatus Borkfalkia faecavium]